MFRALSRSISSMTRAENLKKFAVGVALWSQRQESTTKQEPSTRSWIPCAKNAQLPARDQWQAVIRAAWQAAATNKVTPLKKVSLVLRLFFTSDGVVAGVVIRSAERYDLVKIKPTESEAERYWLCLCLRRLRSSENCIVGVASRSGRINQWQCSIPNFVIGCFFCFCFRLRQSSFHWIISDGVVNGIGRNGNALILLTPIASSLWLCLRLRFSIFTRS